MNLHTIHEPLQETSDNTDPLIGETCQVNALLHIIETLQAQNEGLSTEQQRTIEELKGRVKDLTDKMDFLESELLAERQKNAEIQEQHEAQERARIQQERARLEAVRKATEEERKRLEAEKARKRSELYDIENKHYNEYRTAERVFEYLTTGTGLKYFSMNSDKKSYPDNHFMEPIYKGTRNYSGRTVHIYEIYQGSCEPNHFQYLQSHFQNAMNHYKNLYEETKRQREAIV